MKTLFIQDLKSQSASKLISIAEELNIENSSQLGVKRLRVEILKKWAEDESAEIHGEGTIHILPERYGFIRSLESNYLASPDDIYVPNNFIRSLGLKTGDNIQCVVKPPLDGENYFSVQSVENVNEKPVQDLKHRIRFEDLTPLYPQEKWKLEVEHKDDPKKNLAGVPGRVIDIISPTGKGQRSLIVAPPKTGKTMLLQSIAQSINENYPDVKLFVLLVDERPEEVTDMQRTVRGEVISSTFDEPASQHIRVAEMVIEKAKRLVEYGKDVIVLLDSITRLARAYNTAVPSSGKVLSGGVDVSALQKPKRFFGAARNIEEGGSLTIIATALIETGSKMDEVIFEEFKGTGNSEILLNRKIADRRVYPAIDIVKSATRKEELLIDKDELAKLWVLRRILNPMTPVDAIEFLLDKIKSTKSNQGFFELMNRS